MDFDQWIKSEKLTYEEAAKRIQVATAKTAWRYAKRVQRPDPEVMVRIFRATGGRVTPNDFYDLPDLEERSSTILSSAAFGMSVGVCHGAG